MNWYILYTSARAEKQVEQRLKADGIEAYLPLHLSPRRWSDRVKLIEVPLFSSYIFVRTTDHQLRSLVTVSGVSRIVFHNGTPAILKDSEIEAIKQFTGQVKGLECTFCANDEVQIACGPMKNKNAKVIKTINGFLLLHLEQLGIIVSVNANQVVKQNKRQAVIR
jgi:transcription antitermination factor NusG